MAPNQSGNQGKVQQIASPASIQTKPVQADNSELLARLERLESGLKTENDQLRRELQQALAAKQEARPLSPEQERESRIERHQRRLQEKIELQQSQAAEADAKLQSGEKQYKVGLYDSRGKVVNAERIVGAHNEFEAQQKYQRYFGISGTQHSFRAAEQAS